MAPKAAPSLYSISKEYDWCKNFSGMFDSSKVIFFIQSAFSTLSLSFMTAERIKDASSFKLSFMAFTKDGLP